MLSSVMGNYSSRGLADRYFNILDMRVYIDAHFGADEAFRNKSEWAHMAIRQTACAGRFS
ncbi:MAG: glycogen/starch/alpha-glucan phosphorylase [Lachnospiraceae bacterium]|nr:glycogen/starch/alpha-glucan phosphorylase [Lachnospiraceae bacterium]